MKKMLRMLGLALAISSISLANADVDKPTTDDSLIVTRNGSQASVAGPDNWFTGSARMDPVHLNARPPSRLTAALVTFEPGARTNWHKHPLGQLLIVTAGKGWTQLEGGERVTIHAGDTVWCPPDKKHWHGATSDTAMSHFAVQEKKDGTNVVWLEPVSDQQYSK